MKKLLIVDDDGEIRKLLKVTFGYGKYEVLEAVSGAQALEIAKHVSPDVIILDVMMPGISGIEVCKTIKADPALSKSIVIMLTALNLNEDLGTGLDAGADYYLTKPFNPSELIRITDALLNGMSW